MILQALYEYYQRKAEIHAPIGYELEEIDFVMVIDKNGKLVNIENKRENKRGHQYLVPKAVVRTGKKILPNLLWDNFEYTTGLSKDPSRIKKAKKYNNAFINKIISLPENIKNDDAIKSLLKFYDSDFQEQIKIQTNFEECLKVSGWMTFKLDGGDEIIVNKDIIKEHQKTEFLGGKYEEDDIRNLRKGICLITGKKDTIKRLHTELRISGSDKNVKIVAIQENQGYDSYKKERGYNSPVSIEAESNYSATLKHLLNSKSNRVKIADSTIVFWSEKQSNQTTPEEEAFAAMFGFQKKDEDNPDRNVNVIENFIKSIFNGNVPRDSTNHFYILGLSPNAARISVRFWKAPSVEDFGKNIKKHFDDVEIAHNERNKYLSLYEILASVSVETKKRDKPNVIFFNGKYYDVLPILSGQLVESIIDGRVFPETLLQQCIIRLRAEVSKKDKNGKSIPNVTRTRVAILKAYLNRFNKIYNTNQKEITMALDLTNNDVSYRIGRLFATLEKIQEEANPGINATIRDRFYGAASSTPVTVFPRLLSLKNSHLKKLNEGRKTNFEKLIGEIVNEIKSFPSNLSLNEQANFAIGYYHQRQGFFTSKSEKNEIINNHANKGE